MNAAINVFLRMVDYFVRVFVLKASIGFQGIGVQRRASLHMLFDFALQDTLATIRHDHCTNVSAALKDAHNGSLVFSASPSDPTLALCDVHVPRFAADESFVNFDFAAIAAELYERTRLHGKANPMHHEPSGFLSDTECSGDFVGANAVLAANDEPQSRKPLFKGNRGILKHCPDLEGEFLLWMVAVAAIKTSLFEIGNFLRAAIWAAHHAVRPANGDHELAAVLVF